MLKEIRTRGDIILFIDELHTLVGAGAAEGAIDAASILKPMLARGELQTIGATTLDEYRKHLEKDAALERRFQPIKVEEPTVAHTIEILKGLRDRYEQHHRVTITDQALVAAANLADRYISDRHLPDKAIDLIDEAGSRLRIRRMQAPPDYRELEDEIATTSQGEGSGDRGAAVRARREAPRPTRRSCSSSGRPRRPSGAPRASTSSTRSPRSRSPRCSRCGRASPSTSSPRRRPPSCSAWKTSCTSGSSARSAAIKAVSQSIRRTRAGLKDPKRPSGSFIFLGPSGVGKTETAKTLAEFLFGDETALIQLDMSRVHGEAHGVAARRFASRLRRLRRRRPAHRGRAAQAVLGRALRRDREGAPRRVQHAPPDPGGRSSHRRPGSHGRLQEHRDHHDVEPRHRRPPQGGGRVRQGRRGRHLREDEGEGARGAEAQLPARVPEPHRRDHRLQRAHQGRGHRDRRPADQAGRQASWRARASGSSSPPTPSCCSRRRATTRRSGHGRCAGRSSA